MKKIAVGIAIVFGFTLLQPVSAQAANESIVIIDTAIDSTRSEFKGKIIQEVCLVESGVCPNGTMFQEGSGAASLPVTQAYSNGFEHGTLMSLIALQVNPNVNIIFIRVAGMNPRTQKMYSFSDVSVTRALDWTIANKSKYNIVSVSASAGHASYNRTGSYCPIKAPHTKLVSNIETLMSNGVATMFAAGNGRDRSRINFPACIPQAVAVGGSNAHKAGELPTLSIFFNTAPEVDFYALGTFMTPVKNSVGTSASTVALSAYWAKNYKGTYQATFDYLKSIGKATSNQFTSTNSFVDVLG
jgi:hypothetical protein